MGVLFGAPHTEAERPRWLKPATGCQTKEVQKGRLPELIAEPARADLKGQAREGITADSANDSCMTGCHHGPHFDRGSENMGCSVY